MAVHLQRHRQQRWQVGPNNSLVNPASGRCLDITGNVSTNTTPLQIYDCNGNTGQRWILPQ